jgi:sigma-B regulation protein RsbU (phosphoserine phosphatase)
VVGVFGAASCWLYYDVLDRSDGKVWWLVADVTGEGVSAALLMANFQAAVRVTIDEHEDPAELLNLWNRFLCRNSGRSKFITCLLGLVDPVTRTVRISSAGHHSPLLVRETSPPEELATEGGFPLGIDAEATFASSETSLGAAPVTLLSYTDGITEALDVGGEPFGLERLVQAAGEQKDISPQSLVRHVRRQVTTFVGAAPQSDDITMLGVWLG